jgi:hypothetical protein
MVFKSIVTGHFSKKYAKLTGKNKAFKQQVTNKMKGIRQNPEIGEPKVMILEAFEVYISQSIMLLSISSLKTM